ncbi:MAG TPA: hypothetical protein VD995_26215 [Azospirillum sp.]|nr:hypothetical protein [Azospirillum sp.]
MVRILASVLLVGAILVPGAAPAQDFTRQFEAMPHQHQHQQRHNRQDDWLYQSMVPVGPGQPAPPAAAPRAQWNRLGNLNAQNGPAQPMTQAQPGRNDFRASSRTYGTDQRQATPHYGALRSLNPPQGAVSTTQRRAAPPRSAEPGTVREVQTGRD